MGYVAFGAQVMLSLTFAVAAIAKLRDLAGFRQSLAQLLPVPALQGTSTAVAVPVAELAIAVLLVVPSTSTVGALAAMTMMVAFTATIGRALHRGDHAPCHCFGASPRRLGPQQLVRNLVLTAVAALSLADGRTEPVGLFVAGFVGVVGGLLVVWADDILDLFTAGPAYTR
ncbi:hypothetical protein GCM10010399_33800 [Dactylosporangium fulvum]|uniref:Methylamine utilisation protein MauE domain-containing protein n=1 Tax=Dactylosporangium fulvum TaxID=53359 RepID=A0ABY5W1R6_9ACTN|nr:MauE/DoxX family redox-associated membrane protein [Dactylosporangium fulvum]UWP83209.1 hypothetical protein Dfulv_02565 [Dactylosporangium fulvum]